MAIIIQRILCVIVPVEDVIVAVAVDSIQFFVFRPARVDVTDADAFTEPFTAWRRRQFPRFVSVYRQ